MNLNAIVSNEFKISYYFLRNISVLWKAGRRIKEDENSIDYRGGQRAWIRDCRKIFKGRFLCVCRTFYARIDAGWVRRFGMGQVVYLCCGHGAYAFDYKEFCILVKNGVEWLLS